MFRRIGIDEEALKFRTGDVVFWGLSDGWRGSNGDE
jgi:hypothetical protein